MYSDYTVDSRYLEIIGTFENKLRYQIVEILVAVILWACLLFTELLLRDYSMVLS